MNDATIRVTKTEKKPVEKNTHVAANFGFATGGFVAGMAVSNAFPMTREEAESEETDVVVESEDVQNEEIEVVDDGVQEQLSVETSDFDNSLPSYSDAPIAHVSDSQSFAHAFADARRQVGPGGIFEWHGNLYGTYYADEWESMSQEQRGNYWASVSASAADAHDEEGNTAVAVQEDVNLEQEEDFVDDDELETVEVLPDEEVVVTIEDDLIPSDMELIDENDPVIYEEAMYPNVFESATIAVVEPNSADFESDADVYV
ncbi:MAG: hypothetical protein J6T96_16370 [Bacteroidales bacterium]|nr:hypothetical protein [Bacteroidales bacterium]